MTEQEKREKAIEEMARDMCNSKMSCEECVGVHGDIYFRDKSDCKYCFAATRSFNAGYRKEEEVKKETAKRFLNELMSRVESIDTAYGELWFAVETKEILEIAKEIFGLEESDFRYSND